MSMVTTRRGNVSNKSPFTDTSTESHSGARISVPARRFRTRKIPVPALGKASQSHFAKIGVSRAGS
jgi:hypothetical protein